MLIGVDPLIRGSLLADLDLMGHGDALVICDSNFPARRMTGAEPHRLSVSGPAAVAALASLLPLDHEQPALLMTSQPDDTLRRVQREMLAATGADLSASFLDREAFYVVAMSAQVVVQANEPRAFANMVLRKGTVHVPDPTEP